MSKEIQFSNEELDCIAEVIDDPNLEANFWIPLFAEALKVQKVSVELD